MSKHSLAEQVDALRAEVDSLNTKLDEFLSLQDPDDRFDAPQARYPECVCKNCSARLGIYNPETQELQIRVKDQFLYSRGAPGSHLRIICRRCLTANLLRGD